MSDNSFSIVCCYYNELKLLKKKLKTFLDELKKIKFDYEVIICDNNSEDGTKEYLLETKNFSSEKVRYIFNKKNLGKGGSIKEAIKYSEKKYIVIFDIDEYFLDDLINGLIILNSKPSIDFLIGNRINLKNKFIYRKNFYGVIVLSKLFNFLFNQNLKDTACATKIFKKEIYSDYNFSTNDFDFEFEVLAKFAKNNYKIYEYDIDYKPRTFNEGKKLRAFKDGSMIAKTILKSYF
tara:strand:+ start:353 stop:1057 length:705 start_codon:yes stop_codon:yes gene_type:complete